MFKRNGKFETFVKRQIAMLLAIVMAFSCFVSTGMTFETAHAAVADNEGDGGEAFVADLVEIARLGTPYVWGGWGPVGPNGGVDCRGYVRRALTRVYGLDIFETVGYLVDDNGNPVDGKGNPTKNSAAVLGENTACVSFDIFSAYATLIDSTIALRIGIRRKKTVLALPGIWD